MRSPGSAGAGRTGEATASVPAAGEISRLIARNTVFNLIGRFVYLVGWTLVTPFMLHRLGAERFGVWSLLTVISGLYITFDFGLSSALTKFVAEFHAARDRASLRTTLTLGAALYGGLALVGVIAIVTARPWLLDFFHVAPALRDEARSALAVAAIAYGFLNASALLSSVLSGLHRIDLANRIAIVTTLLQLAGVCVVLARGGGVTAIMLVTGGALALSTVLAALTIRRLDPEIGFGWTGIAPLWGRMRGFGVALQIINLGVLAQFQLDKLLFGRFLSLAAVTSYELGYRVAFAVWSLPALMLPALLPAISHLDASGDRERVRRLYRRASRYVFAAAFPLAAALVALGQPLYAAWLGPGHDDAALAAAALGGFLGVNALTGVGSAVARGVGRPDLEARYHLLAMALHVPLSLVLIPRFGFAGGLMSLVVSGIAGSLYFLLAFHRFMAEPVGRFVLEVVARPAVVAVAAGLLGFAAARIVAGDPGPWDRGRALAAFIAGAGTLAVTTGVGLIATRALGLGELGELRRLVLGRAARAGATAP